MKSILIIISSCLCAGFFLTTSVLAKDKSKAFDCGSTTTSGDTTTCVANTDGTSCLCGAADITGNYITSSTWWQGFSTLNLNCVNEDYPYVGEVWKTSKTAACWARYQVQPTTTNSKGGVLDSWQCKEDAATATNKADMRVYGITCQTTCDSTLYEPYTPCS